VGFNQLVHGFPAALPSGTRPDATAPATVPRKNGVTIEELAKATPKRRLWGSSLTALRKAKPEPRRMMPSATAVSGMYSVDATAANTSGTAVHRITTTKISQTWLASQTGPMTRSMSPRCADPRCAPPANRSQNPPPKSAPPNSA